MCPLGDCALREVPKMNGQDIADMAREQLAAAVPAQRELGRPNAHTQSASHQSTNSCRSIRPSLS
jgi:hypothetical protein